MPYTLNPVPPRLARALTSGQWITWYKAADRAVDATLDALNQESTANWKHPYPLSDAAEWLGNRRLDSLYLRPGFNIWFWTDETTGYTQWDNRGIMFEGLPAWEATEGIYRMPLAEFTKEFHSLNQRFLARMHDRIAIAQTNWSRPDVALDSDLNAEQSHASDEIARAYARAGNEPDNWELVFDAIATIEALPAFNGPRLA
jgi:hypothetical protein